MDFFESQDVARRKTGLLVAYFLMAVVAMIASIYAVAVAVFTVAERKGGSAAAAARFDWWRPEILLLVSGITVMVIVLGSLYKVAQLRGGGEAVATMLGGRRMNSNTRDLDERRVLNVVEEMALASGTPVPPVYILEEDSINAFAAGYTPDDAVIGVNRGTIRYLTRDELQGVMAHEFSHILNGDMRMNIRLIGLLNGILVVSMIGYYMMRVSAHSRRDKGGGQIVLLGIAVFAIGSLGLVFGRLIKAAVSRQREYLADASAVQFTRNPEGIAGALKKIGGLAHGSKVEAAEAESTSHMFFGAAKSQWFSLMATHPPLVERIQRIDARFDGRFPPVKVPAAEAAPPPPKPVETRSPVEALPGPFGKLGGSDRLPLDPLLLLGTIGAPTSDHVSYAHRLIEEMPELVRDAVHDAFSARAVILALLLDDDDAIRHRQSGLIDKLLGEPARRETLKLAEPVAALGAAARLPLIELAHSTLQELSPEQYQAFRKAVDEVMKADERIDLFEFCLHRILIRGLDRHFERAKPPRVRYPALSGVAGEVSVLVSALAYLGHEQKSDVERAFHAAAALFSSSRPLELRPPDACGLADISKALDKLEQSSPPIKKRVIQAVAVSIATDGRVTVAEAEVLRAIGDALDCPVPPLYATPPSGA